MSDIARDFDSLEVCKRFNSTPAAKVFERFTSAIESLQIIFSGTDGPECLGNAIYDLAGANLLARRMGFKSGVVDVKCDEVDSVEVLSIVVKQPVQGADILVPLSASAPDSDKVKHVKIEDTKRRDIETALKLWMHKAGQVKQSSYIKPFASADIKHYASVVSRRHVQAVIAFLSERIEDETAAATGACTGVTSAKAEAEPDLHPRKWYKDQKISDSAIDGAVRDGKLKKHGNKRPYAYDFNEAVKIWTWLKKNPSA